MWVYSISPPSFDIIGELTMEIGQTQTETHTDRLNLILFPSVGVGRGIQTSGSSRTPSEYSDAGGRSTMAQV